MSKCLSGPLSPEEIEDRFEEAARTLRRLPDRKPQGYFNVWPTVVRTHWEILAMEPQPMKVWATPQSIDRMDECFAWLFWLEPDDARIVWMRAEGMGFRAIARRLGTSRSTAWRRWATALILISNRIRKAASNTASRRPRKIEAANNAPTPRQMVE